MALARTLRAAVADESRPVLRSGLLTLARTASQLRERLSLDNWRTLNRMRAVSASQRTAGALADVALRLDITIGHFTTCRGTRSTA